MPHRPSHNKIWRNAYAEVYDYMDRNNLKPSEFRDVYMYDHHGLDLTKKQKRAFGVLVRYRTRRGVVAYRLVRRMTRRREEGEVQLVRGKGKKLVLVFKFIRDKKGQVHKVGRDGKYMHINDREFRKLHGRSRKAGLRVNKSRPSQAKKGVP